MPIADERRRTAPPARRAAARRAGSRSASSCSVDRSGPSAPPLPTFASNAVSFPPVHDGAAGLRRRDPGQNVPGLPAFDRRNPCARPPAPPRRPRRRRDRDVVVWRYPAAPFVPTQPTATATEAVGHTLAHHTRLRRLLVVRLDPSVATGLALTLALGVIILGGLVLAVLAYLVRSSDRLVDLDESVAQWGFDHASDLSDAGLQRRHDARRDMVRDRRSDRPRRRGAVRKRPTRWVPPTSPS